MWLTDQLFIPHLSLAIEYNGEYHYQTVLVHDDVGQVHTRDMIKRDLCEQYGVTLIVIPFWWDRAIESVAKTIHMYRPDISLPEELMNGKEIPSQMPKQQEDKGMHQCFMITSCSDLHCKENL